MQSLSLELYLSISVIALRLRGLKAGMNVGYETTISGGSLTCFLWASVESYLIGVSGHTSELPSKTLVPPTTTDCELIPYLGRI